LVIFQYDRS